MEGSWARPCVLVAPGPLTVMACPRKQGPCYHNRGWIFHEVLFTWTNDACCLAGKRPPAALPFTASRPAWSGLSGLDAGRDPLARLPMDIPFL